MMKDKIEKLLRDFQKFHSEFQIENFIIRSQGNLWGQYKQCLREISSRNDQLQDLEDDLKLIRIDIDQMNQKWFFFKISSKKRHEIKLQKMIRKKESLKANIKEISRELSEFVRIGESIRYKAWGNSTLSGEKIKALEKQMWHEKARFMMAIDLITIGNISKSTIEMIYSMPRKMKSELLSY